MSAPQRSIVDDAAHVAYRLTNSQKRPWPYAHMILDDVLPRDLFEALRSIEIPADAWTRHASYDDDARNERFRYSVSVSAKELETESAVDPLLIHTYQVLTHPFATQAMAGAFSKELLAAFGTTALPMRCGLTFNEDRSGYELLPHTDVAYKAITLLIYLADDGANPDLGTEIFVRSPHTRPTEDPMHQRYYRSHFLKVATAPYRANSGLIFAPTEQSFHGVSRVESAERTRRQMQFQLMI
ncbi:MAG: 2OG-Fe(II) oxygenase, partial [bacterium]|nr:2OG-Fe(II) oxygenase [bacterium]